MRSYAVRAGVGLMSLLLVGTLTVSSAETSSAASTASFRIGTFNILGSWHTRAGHGNSEEAPGPMRAHLAAEVIRAYNPGVVGLQEAEPDQVPIMAAELPQYDFWPALTLDWYGVRNNIAYDNRRFRRTAQSYVTITFLGDKRYIPYIRLQHIASGRQFWVMNAHNTPKRNGESWMYEERERQLDAELGKIRQLEATGLPVFFVGDMNDRIRLYCRTVSETMQRAVQGYPGGCELPQNTHIEWIFGSRTSWSDFKYDYGSLSARVTDHHLMWATATLR